MSVAAAKKPVLGAWERRRIIAVMAGLALLFAGLIARLAFLQVKEGPRLAAVARRLHRRVASLKPWRGDIFFRESGRRVLVAGSVPRYSMLVYGKQDKPQALIESLQSVLKLDDAERGYLRERLARGRAFWFRRKGIDFEQARVLRKGLKTLVRRKAPEGGRARYEPKLAGFEVREDSARLYPFGRLASHILGFPDDKGRGSSGIEARFDKLLRGSAGRREFEIDARRNQLAPAGSLSEPARPGRSLQLSIDRRIQLFAEDAVSEAWDKWKPESIALVAVEPSSGRILALVCRPDFDPARPYAFKLEDKRNRVLTDPYEPGSTIKPVLISRVWEKGLGGPERPIRLPRRLKVKGRRKPVLDSHQVRVKDRGTREKDVIIQSSNVGSFLLSSRLDDAAFRAALRDFGFSERSGLPLAGENPGRLSLVRDLSPANRAALAQGYGLMVTPVQMALAYAAIANGGTLYSPLLVEEVLDEDGGVVERFEPQPRRRVLSARVAREQMAQALEQVVGSRYGTARRTAIEGYPMAGKTGTSKKHRKDPQTGKWGYDAKRTVCSFCGFAPVEQPRIAIVVVVNDPTLKHGRTFGGNVAAPVAAAVVRKTLNYLQVPKLESEEEASARAPRARRGSPR